MKKLPNAVFASFTPKKISRITFAFFLKNLYSKEALSSLPSPATNREKVARYRGELKPRHDKKGRSSYLPISNKNRSYKTKKTNLHVMCKKDGY